ARTILPRLLFPVGGYTKNEIRAIARSVDLGVADKPDSVEICFVPNGDHATMIRRRRPALATAGYIADKEGNRLAEHDGIERFTIGQRKGLRFAAGERRYVLQIVPGENEIVVGAQEDLLGDGLIASRVNWLIEPPCSAPLTCSVKIRYRHSAVPSQVVALPDSGARVEFARPQSAVTPGQAVVFYDGSRVLGGGWIEKVLD